jgi:phosphate transport system permease protein
MTSVLVEENLASDLVHSQRGIRARRLGRANRIFHGWTFVAAISVIGMFLGMFVALLIGASPALRKFGFNFLISDAWNPVRENFGIFPLIVGTLVTSALAMLIAVPIGLGIAIFLTEICPRFLRTSVGIAIELLAGIPSIIYGIWGLFVFAPWFQHTLEPAIIAAFAPVPILRDLFAGPPFGIGVFAASVILAIMILPFIAAITRDVFAIVPPVLKEAAYGLGSTVWEVVWRVVLPYSRAGVVGGSMLALGRALGETMAVTFVIGNAHKLSASILAPGTTISATIANEFSEAVEEIYQSSLLASGLFLMFITFTVLAIAQIMLSRVVKHRGA